jgi:hypothetical protein
MAPVACGWAQMGSTLTYEVYKLAQQAPGRCGRNFQSFLMDPETLCTLGVISWHSWLAVATLEPSQPWVEVAGAGCLWSSWDTELGEI